MIIRRDRSSTHGVVRRIVRRNRPAVGEARPRQVVRRRSPGIGEGVIPATPRARLAWRPSRQLIAGIASLLVASAIIAAGYGLLRSPLFRIDTIQVVGNDRIATTTVVETANLLGANLVTADLAAAQRALYGLPLVASARVERHWPSTIRIVVEERRPWGTWEQAGVDYIIDREGVVIDIGTALPDAPVIRSSEPGSRLIGDRVDYQAVDAAAELFELLPTHLGTTVAEVAFVRGKGVQVTTADGQVALLGDSSSIAYKLAVWAAVAAEARQRHIAYTTIDLRYGNRPVLQ